MDTRSVETGFLRGLRYTNVSLTHSLRCSHCSYLFGPNETTRTRYRVRLAPKGNTRSRLFTDVKPCWTGLISGWVTFWIDFLSCTPWTSVTPSTSTTNVVCGLSFSRSQPDFEGFLRALRFPLSSNSTPSLIHLAVVLCSEVIYGSVVFRCRSPSWLHSFFYPTSFSCVLRNSVSDCEKGPLAGQILLTAQSEPTAILK